MITPSVFSVLLTGYLTFPTYGEDRPGDDSSDGTGTLEIEGRRTNHRVEERDYFFCPEAPGGGPGRRLGYQPDAGDVSPALLLEQQGRKVNQIISPDRPLVVTWGFDGSHGQSFCLEFGNGSLVRL
jgi:hypothetical protein